MRSILIFIAAFYTAVYCLPPLTKEQENLVKVFGKKVLSFSGNITSYHGKRLSLKYKYVAAGGVIHNSKGGVCSVTVEATPGVSETAHYRAAKIIAGMTKFMPSTIFHALCQNTKIGVFTKHEKITTFPEYAAFKDTPACRNRCDGSCSKTCTADGRKFDSLAGGGGKLACILDDNVLCNAADPYYGTNNILVHEYSHSIHGQLPQYYKTKITEAYNNARRHRSWEMSSYAMSNEGEYFAEAAGTWFNVEHQSGSTGGMNTCGHAKCTDERDSRTYIYNKDRPLYNILAYVFDNNAWHPSGLQTCVT